jgi:hypothetical protein
LYLQVTLTFNSGCWWWIAKLEPVGMKHFIFKSLVASLIGLAVVSAKAEVIFSDNMENGVNNWVTWGYVYEDIGAGLWHQSDRRAQSGTNSWYMGIESAGHYDTGGENISMLTSPAISLVGVTNPELTFKTFLAFESQLPWDDDLWYVSILSTNNQYIGYLSSGTSGSGQWENPSFNLSDWAGQTIKLRFEVSTFSGCSDCEEPEYAEGWYIDDVIITGTR